MNPPDNRIFFPGGAMIDPGGQWMYVINSNSDLRYNAGTVSVVDLDAVRRDDPRDLAFQCPTGATADACWSKCPLDPRYVPPADSAHTCCWDTTDENILNCDEQDYIRRDSTVRIGSFGGRPVMQTTLSPEAKAPQRMYVPVRGDTSITFMNVNATADGVALACTGTRSNPDPASPFALCDDHWRITRADDPLDTTSNIPDDQVANLPLEPYALEVDNEAELLYIGHLRGGIISLVDLGLGSTGDTRPNLTQLYVNLLPPDVNGQQGVTSLTIKDKGYCGAVYVASRFRPVIASFVVYGLDGCPVSQTTAQENRTVAIVSSGQILSTGLIGSETRGIEFPRRSAAAAPDRAFILQRTPPALVAVDLATLSPFATIETCQGPTHLVQQLGPDGGTIALFVTCFDAGEVDVVDPWAPRMRTAVPVGRGPITTVLDPTDTTRAYVVGFGGNNMVVMSLDPDLPGHDRVVQRIGFPSATPRDTGPNQP